MIMAIRILLIFLVMFGTLAFLYTRGVFHPRVDAGDATIFLPQEFPGAKELGDPVIIRIVGTSLTTRGDWPRTIEAALNQCSNAHIIVDHVAKAGNNSTFALTNLDRILGLTDIPTPDIVAIEFSGNDASLYHGMSVANSRSIHRKLVQTLHSSGIRVALATMSPAFGRKALERPGQDAYHAIYRDLSKNEPVILIDTIAVWRALSREEHGHYLPDGLHPTPDAMDSIVVPAFLEAFTPLLCR